MLSSSSYTYDVIMLDRKNSSPWLAIINQDSGVIMESVGGILSNISVLFYIEKKTLFLC